jgi:4-aminobutyrate aminotransferase-like enzyme
MPVEQSVVNRDSMPNSFDPRRSEELAPRMAELIARRSRLLGPGYRLFYDRPLEVVRGTGVRVYDADGIEYLDAYNNVPCVGHCHPRVVEAIARQAATLNTHTRYVAEPILAYAERLLATLGAGQEHVMFTCSGSEATDLALRIARHSTGARGVVVTSNAYHGVTTAAAEISPSLGPSVAPGPDVRAIPPPDPSLGDAAAVGERLAADLTEAAADLERSGAGFAAFVADSIFSSDGIVPAPAGFLLPLVAAAHNAGGLYVADEVQSGFARTGEAMWGFQRQGVAPDLVTMGKPMGNGMPIAAVSMRAELGDDFGRDVRYFNTFGGNSVCIAAATAVLDVIGDEDLLEHVSRVGPRLMAGIEAIAASHDVVGEVRGAGLYVGVDLVDEATGAPDAERALRVVNGLRDRHVLISATGLDQHTLKIRPPLVFGADDADRLVTELDAVLRDLDP